MSVRQRTYLADGCWSGALTVLILGPLLVGPGYWLVGDMVFVPVQSWKDDWLGVGAGLPRAVPMDAVVSLLTQVAPGWLVQRVLLVGAFMAGGLGIARLLRDHAWYARAAAIGFFLWNPWVHERLHIGQWAILSGYLLLPWVVHTARGLRRGHRGAWAPAALALVLSAVCSPSSGLMALGVLLVLGAGRSLRSSVTVVGLGVLANLTWLVPSLTAARVTVSVDDVFELFAARAESAAGVLPSLLSMGGIWKSSIVAGERTSVAIVLVSCVLTGAALLGLRLLDDPAESRRLLLLALLCLVVAAVPTSGVGVDVWTAVGDRVPAAALLRDSHRFLAPAALAVALGLAGCVTWLRAQVAPGREAVWAVIGLVLLAPMALLPSLAWGGGELHRTDYPADWHRVADLMDGEPPTTTVVLPWSGSYRGFSWNDRRAGLDPAPRFFPGEVLADDRTLVDGSVVPSEDPVLAQVGAAVADHDDAAGLAAALRGMGVRWVVVELDQPGLDVVPLGRAAYAGQTLTLVDLGEPGRSTTSASHDDHALLVLSGHAGAFGLLVVAGTAILRAGSNDRHTSVAGPAKSLGGD